MSHTRIQCPRLCQHEDIFSFAVPRLIRHRAGPGAPVVGTGKLLILFTIAPATLLSPMHPRRYHGPSPVMEQDQILRCMQGGGVPIIIHAHQHHIRAVPTACCTPPACAADSSEENTILMLFEKPARPAMPVTPLLADCYDAGSPCLLRSCSHSSGRSEPNNHRQGALQEDTVS